MQMWKADDIPAGYSASQAASILAVDPHEVARLHRAGVLAGRKIAGGALVLDPSSVQARAQTPRLCGRPWEPDTAWAALMALDGDDASWLPYHRRRRLALKLAETSAEELVWLSRKRMTANRYRASGSFADDLRPELALSGMSAAAASAMGLVADATTIDGYAADGESLARDLYLIPDAAGNCVIRTAVGAPAGLIDRAEMPPAIVAADLASSLDARERRCGLDYLKGALDGIR